MGMTTYQYKLSSLDYLTEDIVLIGFEPKDTSPILSYQSGQYIEVLTKENTVFPLSIANSPNLNPIHDVDNLTMGISVHLRSGPHHPVAENFLTEIKKQGFIEFAGPKGHCIVKPADHYYFIAGGTGFSPIHALLTDLLPSKKTCTLYWGVSHPKDLYQEKLMAIWQTHYSNFEYVPVLLTPEKSWPGKTGWVHKIFIQEQAVILNNHRLDNKTYYTYASGPYPMIQAIQHEFISHQLNLDCLLSDMLETKT